MICVYGRIGFSKVSEFKMAKSSYPAYFVVQTKLDFGSNLMSSGQLFPRCQISGDNLFLFYSFPSSSNWTLDILIILLFLLKQYSRCCISFSKGALFILSDSIRSPTHTVVCALRNSQPRKTIQPSC